MFSVNRLNIYIILSINFLHFMIMHIYFKKKIKLLKYQYFLPLLAILCYLYFDYTLKQIFYNNYCLSPLYFI